MSVFKEKLYKLAKKNRKISQITMEMLYDQIDIIRVFKPSDTLLVFLPSPKRKVKNLIKEYYQTFSDVLKKGNEACFDVLLGNVLSIKNILTV